MKTRAVHLEVVSGESSIAFIGAYEQFIGRRARCQKLYSDNGKNFVGAEKAIRTAMDSWLQQATMDHIHGKGTEWHFMSPAAPHQGGIYEAAVKSMKHHLKRVIGLSMLEHNQFVILLTQIEAILNSRPLHPLNDDPNDVRALTPGHFLVGEPMVLPTSFNVAEESKSHGAKLFKERQKMLMHFWERWRQDYLCTLQERKKWRKEKENLKIGQLVLLGNEKFPPAAWALGRVIELKASKDGLIRTAVVKTASSTFTRPIQKLCIIPTEVENLDYKI